MVYAAKKKNQQGYESTMEEKEPPENGLKLICQNQVICSCQPSSASPSAYSQHFPERVIHHSLEEHWPYIGQWFGHSRY